MDYCKQLKSEAERVSRYLSEATLQQICLTQKKIVGNLDAPTNGGPIAWEDLCRIGEWRIQHNLVFGQCRVLNGSNRRVAGGTPEQIVAPVLDYIHREEQRRLIRNRNWSIVFCGGGGKGAYQIGVWKWLREIGLDRMIFGVSGASVGALNSLLFVQGDLSLAERVWLSVRQEDLTPMDSSGLEPGIFSQHNLQGIIRRNVRKTAVVGANRLIYTSLSALSLPHKDQTGPHIHVPVYPCWAGRSWAELEQIVLASASIPVVFSPRWINGKFCVDGGVRDNAPAVPLAEDGFRHIIIIHLKTREETSGKVREMEETCRLVAQGELWFHHVWPSSSLGSALVVNPDKTARLIGQGYRDARRQLPFDYEEILFSR